MHKCFFFLCILCQKTAVIELRNFTEYTFVQSHLEFEMRKTTLLAAGYCTTLLTVFVQRFVIVSTLLCRKMLTIYAIFTFNSFSMFYKNVE